MRWSVDPRPPRDVIAGAQTDWARIALRSGRTVDVYRPGVRGDSIVGRSSAARRPLVGRSSAGIDARDVALSLSGVARIEWQSVDEGATVRSVAWIATGSLLLVAALFLFVGANAK